jgi:hypothetical protein
MEEKSNGFRERPRAFVPYASMMLDEDYRVCSYSRAAFLLFGYAEVSMIGKPICGILPGLEDMFEIRPERLRSASNLMRLIMEAKHVSGKTFPVAVGLREHDPVGTYRHLLLVRNLNRQEA